MTKKKRPPASAGESAPRATDPTDSNTTGPVSASMVEQVVELAARFGLAELEVEEDGRRVRVVRLQAPSRDAAPAPAPRVAEQLAGEAIDAHLVPVEAPMVGTFYRAPSPESPPFVNEGDVIKQGQVLCIIEAMKLMNEIEAKAAGRVARILVQNAQPVEYGQTLFLIEPLR
jgi:acetyl-CoA carboxylase biotin carboxyl carrier protein